MFSKNYTCCPPCWSQHCICYPLRLNISISWLLLSSTTLKSVLIFSKPCSLILTLFQIFLLSPFFLSKLPLYHRLYFVCQCVESMCCTETIVIPNAACLLCMLLAGCPQFLQPQITECENFCRSVGLIRQLDARDQRGCQQCSCQQSGTKQGVTVKQDCHL